MAAEKAPAYQWYPKDYDTDEAVKFMTYEQEGIYRRLLDHQALHGSIPSDPAEIAMLVPKCSPKRFLAHWPRLSGKFEPVEGRLVNPKLERVRADTAAFKERKSKNGKAGAEKRWQRDGKPIAPEIANVSPASASASASATASERTRAAHTGSGVLAGSLPRDHMRHAICGRVCLQETQFQQFVRKLGGEEPCARVGEWVRTVLEHWDTPPLMNQPIQGNNFQWWDARWAEWQGTPKAARAASPLPDHDAHLWTCPHTPHCPHRAACAVVSARPAVNA